MNELRNEGGNLLQHLAHPERQRPRRAELLGGNADGRSPAEPPVPPAHRDFATFPIELDRVEPPRVRCGARPVLRGSSCARTDDASVQSLPQHVAPRESPRGSVFVSGVRGASRRGSDRDAAGSLRSGSIAQSTSTRVSITWTMEQSSPCVRREEATRRGRARTGSDACLSASGASGRVHAEGGSPGTWMRLLDSSGSCPSRSRPRAIAR